CALWISRWRVAKKRRGSVAPVANSKVWKRVAAKSQTFAGKPEHYGRPADFLNHLATKNGPDRPQFLCPQRARGRARLDRRDLSVQRRRRPHRRGRGLSPHRAGGTQLQRAD